MTPIKADVSMIVGGLVLLTHVVILVIERAVWYHLSEKTLNKKEDEKNEVVACCKYAAHYLTNFIQRFLNNGHSCLLLPVSAVHRLTPRFVRDGQV